MLVHSNPLFRIYFGDVKDQLFPKDYLNLPAETDLLEIEPYQKLKKLLGIEQLFFLRQMHNSEGITLTEDNAKTLEPFRHEGDYLVTNLKKVGLGVMTGDCLPIVFHDTRNNVVAITHAGWQGSVNRVAIKTVETMQQQFKTDLEHLRIFFGPSAKPCCYKVEEDFLSHLESFSFGQEVVQKHGDYLFFDLPGFNRLQLEGIGIKKEAFRLDYNICTICDETFHSYRRDGKKAGRQMTVVSLV